MGTCPLIGNYNHGGSTSNKRHQVVNFFRKMGLTLLQVAWHIKRVGYSEYLGFHVHCPHYNSSQLLRSISSIKFAGDSFKDNDMSYKTSIFFTQGQFICIFDQADKLLYKLLDRSCYKYGHCVSQVPKGEQYTTSII